MFQERRTYVRLKGTLFVTRMAFVCIEPRISGPPSALAVPLRAAWAALVDVVIADIMDFVDASIARRQFVPRSFDQGPHQDHDASGVLNA
jgi:hypothetical protein